MFTRTRISTILLACMLIGLTLAVEAQARRRSKPQVVALHRINYAMASPRACLLGHNSTLPAPAAAENFARKPGIIVVRAGRTIGFCLSRELEGVWYPHAFGRLGTSLVLELASNDVDAANIIESLKDTAGPNDSEAICAKCEWVVVGRDGACGVRWGPSIGRARVGVRHRFKEPGVYLLRGIIRTVAQPLVPPVDAADGTEPSGTDPNEDVPPPPVPTFDKDIVYVCVKVLGPQEEIPEPEEQEAAPSPDLEYTEPMVQGFDEEYEEQLDALLGDLEDLAYLAQEPGENIEDYDGVYEEDED